MKRQCLICERPPQSGENWCARCRKSFSDEISPTDGYDAAEWAAKRARIAERKRLNARLASRLQSPTFTPSTIAKTSEGR